MGFDATVVVTLSVTVAPTLTGIVSNTAVISNPAIAAPVTVTAETMVTDDPILTIAKSSVPLKPGANKLMTYTLTVANLGQQATALMITDTIPADTEYVDGSATVGGQLVGDQIQWGLAALPSGKSHTLSFRVTVLGGYRIVNNDYAVRSAEGAAGVGAPVVTMVIRTSYEVYLPLIAKNY